MKKRHPCSEKTKQKIGLANRKLSDKQREKIKQLYLASKLPTITQDLARAFKVSSPTILKWVCRLGGKKRTRSEIMQYRLASGWRRQPFKLTPLQLARVTRANRISGKKRIGTPHPFSPEAWQRQHIRMKEHNPMQNPETAKKVSQKLKNFKWPQERNLKIKKLWQNKYYVAKQMKARKVCPNKSEQKLAKTLAPLNYKYVGDGQFILAGKCPDFVNCNGQKKIIELFGEPFHTDNEAINRKRLFLKYGYQTLIIWANELNNHEKLIGKIRRFDEK